jgi:hypothetical protein
MVEKLKADVVKMPQALTQGAKPWSLVLFVPSDLAVAHRQMHMIQFECKYI